MLVCCSSCRSCLMMNLLVMIILWVLQYWFNSDISSYYIRSLMPANIDWIEIPKQCYLECLMVSYINMKYDTWNNYLISVQNTDKNIHACSLRCFWLMAVWLHLFQTKPYGWLTNHINVFWAWSYKSSLTLHSINKY